MQDIVRQQGRVAVVTGGAMGIGVEVSERLAEFGITANAVAPGPVDTPMTQVLHTPEFKAQYATAIPMRRYTARRPRSRRP